MAESRPVFIYLPPVGEGDTFAIRWLEEFFDSLSEPWILNRRFEAEKGGFFFFWFRFLLAGLLRKKVVVLNLSESRLLDIFCKLFSLPLKKPLSLSRLRSFDDFEIVADFDSGEGEQKEKLLPAWTPGLPQTAVEEPSVRLLLSGEIPRPLLAGCIGEFVERFPGIQLLLPEPLKKEFDFEAENIVYESEDDYRLKYATYIWPRGAGPAPQAHALDCLGSSIVLAPANSVWRKITAPPQHEYLYPPDRPEFALDLLQRFEEDEKLCTQILSASAELREDYNSRPGWAGVIE